MSKQKISLWLFIPSMIILGIWLYIPLGFSVQDFLVTNLPDKLSRMVNVIIWGAVAFVFADLMFTKRIVKGGKSKDGKRQRI